MIQLKLIFLALFSSFLFQSPCKVEDFKSNCTKELGDNFTVVKTYILDSNQVNKDGFIEESFFLSKNTEYKLSFCDENGTTQNVEIRLLNPEHKEVMSNFSEKEEIYSVIDYNCETTGHHYFKFKLKNNIACAISVLGFKRN